MHTACVLRRCVPQTAVVRFLSTSPWARGLRKQAEHRRASADRMPSVFLSYGRGEVASPFAQWLKHKLEQRGFHVWLDKCSITGGSDWQKAIADGIVGCDALVALIDQKFTVSQYW